MPGEPPTTRTDPAVYFVSASRLARHEPEDLFGHEAMLRIRLFEPDVRDLDLARMEAARSDDEPDLAAVHGHGELGANGGTGNLSAGRIHPEGISTATTGTPARVDALDQRCRVAARFAVESSPEQRIDDNVGIAVELFARFEPRLCEESERDLSVAAV